ncbi:hypothetical protein BKA80DRAFT_46990 [Phyllosticta citrichinensis]
MMIVALRRPSKRAAHYFYYWRSCGMAYSLNQKKVAVLTPTFFFALSSLFFLLFHTQLPNHSLTLSITTQHVSPIKRLVFFSSSSVVAVTASLLWESFLFLGG